MKCSLLLAAAMFLPAILQGAEPFAVVTVPVANLREEPRHGSEMLSQGILGTPLKILSETGEWLQVEMPDGYRGHMIANGVQQMDSAAFDAWRSSARVCVSDLYCNIHVAPDTNSDVVSPLQMGDIVAYDEPLQGTVFMKVHLPDGRSGYMDFYKTRLFEPFSSAVAKDCVDEVAREIIESAREMMGQEYLWGGTSAKAADCSGFTRIIFQNGGIYLPRDAWQQAEAGEEVDYSSLQPGDLIFFSNAKGRVNHVGIYEGDGVMLHCSGRVREDLIGPSSRTDLPEYHKKPSSFRRIIGVELPSDRKANQLYFK